MNGGIASGSGTIVNAMTVDVEDYFHVSAFERFLIRDDWDLLPQRVHRNTDSLLHLFDEHRVKATFFVLGWVAERHPDLVRRIADAGHEIASHGFAHVRVGAQDPDMFRRDVDKTKKLLEDVSGTAVSGYRAASFSVGGATSWAYGVLGEVGYRYSSSIYPIRHDHYGAPTAPRFPYRPAADANVVELPVTAVPLFGTNVPCGGGGYFRLLPYTYSRWAIGRVNRRDRQPAVFYVHPWEVDPDQPRMPAVSAKTRFRHYTNLHAMKDKLGRVLRDFRWDRVDRVFQRSFGAPAEVEA